MKASETCACGAGYSISHPIPEAVMTELEEWRRGHKAICPFTNPSPDEEPELAAFHRKAQEIGKLILGAEREADKRKMDELNSRLTMEQMAEGVAIGAIFDKRPRISISDESNWWVASCGHCSWFGEYSYAETAGRAIDLHLQGKVGGGNRDH